MHIAALYDIHGNLPALEAVLGAVESEAVDAVVVGGDVVPGPMPAECLDALEALDAPVHFLRGNGENDLLNAYLGNPLDRVPEPFRNVVRWCARQLSPRQMQAIEGWPATVGLEMHTGPVLFCHATPRDDNEIFTRLTPDFRLTPIFDAVPAELVVCGHTHMQFDRSVGSTRVINAGSVGMAFGETRACWLLLGPDGPELRQTEYDREAAQDILMATEYPMIEQLASLNPPRSDQMEATFEAAAVDGRFPPASGTA